MFGTPSTALRLLLKPNSSCVCRKQQRIEVNPRVMLGKPVIRGTRVPVELLRKLSEGSSESDLLAAYPGLTREDIHAAMRYAADTLAHEQVVFVDKDAARNRE